MKPSPTDGDAGRRRPTGQPAFRREPARALMPNAAGAATDGRGSRLCIASAVALANSSAIYSKRPPAEQPTGPLTAEIPRMELP